MDSTLLSLQSLPGGPVVGVGASAGGLEALEQFFTHVPPDSGMAYVVVQHLDPDKKSLLAELLQRFCPIPVVVAEEGMPLALNQVFVAPPGCELSLLHGVLHLLKPVPEHGLRLPIDAFFRSLALDQQSNAAGVVLSGMGGDGTLGLQALKEKAGGIFVQSPESAGFQGMPRHALQAELGDVVTSADQLPGKILAYFAHAKAEPLSEQASAAMQPAVDKVLILVRSRTGHDFSDYKKSTVRRRIQRRMAIHQLDTVDDYVGYVRQNPLEAELLFKELLIGVISFFRDPDVWLHLKSELLPKLLESYPDGGVLRAWVAACSTGEEAYTLAMTFAEALSALQPKSHFSLQIFATDMDKARLKKRASAFTPTTSPPMCRRTAWRATSSRCPAAT